MTMDISIRAYEPPDAGVLADVFYRSVREAARADYSEAQVQVWAPTRPDPALMHRRATDGRLLLVATAAGDRPVAYIDLEADGHIDHLFCLPEAVGHGVASRLYDAIETSARQRRMTRLYVEASESARRVFLRKGFTEEKRQDLIRGGIQTHNYVMYKELPADGS
jgi:putative acetyltransferase